jgi:hypothetical protein
LSTAPSVNNPDEHDPIDTILARSPPLGLEIPEGTSFQDWQALGERLAFADNSLAWRVGDWWVYGEHRYGDRVAAVHSQGWNGPSFGACRNYAIVSRAFEMSRRRYTLSFSHHREVAGLSAEDAERLLDWAEEPLRQCGKPRSTRELRRQIQCQSGTRDRGIDGSRYAAAGIFDAISELFESHKPQEQKKRPRRPLFPFLRLDDSGNILPVPAELAALRLEPAPDLDRVAMARAALAALDRDQRIALFMEFADELVIAHARLQAPP